MPQEQSGDAERIEQVFRIEELKSQVEALAGGQMAGWISPDCPPDLEEQFWQQVVAFESAPASTHLDQLAQAGVELLPPDDMDDLELSVKLWEVIEGLAQARVYLESTDHLSDRELYTYLYTDGLHEWAPVLPPGMEMNCHLSPVGSGNEEDTRRWLQYYADDDTRRRWLRDNPDDDIPPHQDPPHDRDRHLPHAVYEAEEDEEEE